MSFVSESLFKISSLVILVLLSLVIEAHSETPQKTSKDKENKEFLEPFFLLEEANFINSGAFDPSKLTRIGETKEENKN